MAREKEKKDVEEKRGKKDQDKQKVVTFVHERLTELPPLRYPVGQEPPLPPWPINWTPIAICMESSVPGLSIDVLTENFNKLARPAMSMAVVHPKDLAEDEMAIDGTVLSEMLKKAKEEPNASWPPSNLLVKCLKSRSILDRNTEHRNEELRRASALIEAKQATEDFKEKLAVAKGEVALAETNLKSYRTKLLEEMRTKRAERKRDSKVTNKADDSEIIGETELSKGSAKQNESKGKKVDHKDKKEGKVGKKPRDKAQKSQNTKARDEEPEPVLVPVISSRDQFKLYEEEVTNKKTLVKELEAKLLSSGEKQATLLSTLLDPFTTGRLYCIIGLDLALPVIQLACEEKSFFKAIFNVVPRPDKATDNSVPELISASELTDSNMEKQAVKEAKKSKKGAKAAPVATSSPSLVAEIKSIVENGSVMEPARSVSVVDVFYETTRPPEYDGDNEESKKQEKVVKNQKDETGDKKRKENGLNKTEKKTKARKENQWEVGDKGDEEKVETKGKKSKTTKKVVGEKDQSLPYEQVAEAVVSAVQRLVLQVELYGAMGGDKVKIFKVPEAKPSQETDRSYYNHLLNKFPQGLVTVPIIVHCLLEQVATYQWPREDIEAVELLNWNKRIRNGIYHEFKKLGHPKWIGVQGDIGEELPTIFEGPYNVEHKKTKVTLPSKEVSNGDVLPGAKVQETLVGGSPLKCRQDEFEASTTGCCALHWNNTDTSCPTIHKSHVDGRDEPVLRKGHITKVYNPYAQVKELEDRLRVIHEFDTITQVPPISKPVELELNTESINPTKVQQCLSMLRAAPARSRYKMPGTPTYSDEKMGASLTALQDLCDHYDEDHPIFQSLEEALFSCKDLRPSKVVDINTMQRYKKLIKFLEMIKEDKDVFPDLDIPVEDISQSNNVTKGPYNLDKMKYWCHDCLAFFKRSDVMEETPKEPLTDAELNQLKKMFRTKLLDDYEKQQLDKDQPPKQIKEESGSINKDALDQEMIEAGLSPMKSKEEQEKDEITSKKDLDPRVVKLWCIGCQLVFLPPPPPTLEEMWNEGRRMREETDRLKAREDQAVVIAKIEAWKRLEKKLERSILGRQYAEGFADGLMGEVYARAKLQLPFEMIQYDHDEDCILSCLYAANSQRNVQEQIPCLMQFGDFCDTYDLASGEPIKKRFAVYEMEPQYKLVLDERRYLLTEEQGLVICGLPAKSPVQYEPRETIYKDGNIIMLRAIKEGEKSREMQEVFETETGFDFGNEGDLETKGRMHGSSPGTKNVVSRTKTEEEGDVPTKQGKESVSTKGAKGKHKGKVGREETHFLDSASAVVQEQVTADHSSVPLDLLNGEQGLTDSDCLSPSCLDLQIRVIACLKDGVIATFFFAKDGTLHLQINIPGEGRIFEITSNGEVIFLPLEIKKQKPKPDMEILPPSYPHAPQSKDTLKHDEKKILKREVSPLKENTKGDKPKTKNIEDSRGNDGEHRVKSKKKTGQEILDKPEKEEKQELDDNVEPGKEGEEGQVFNNLELINGLSKKHAGDMEVSRCILPSRSVVSYKENGQTQILYNNGNISEYKIILEDKLGWVTTNNKGFCVLQDPPTAKPAMDDEVTSPEDTILSSKNGKGQNKGAKKEKTKAAKQQELELKLETDPKTKDVKAGHTKQKNAKKDGKVVSIALEDDVSVSMTDLLETNPNLPPVATERCHVQLPSKKVVQIVDPDSKSSLITREDLVVVMNTNDNTVRLVQHADGTHIYSEVKETIHEYNPSVGQISLDETKKNSLSIQLKPTNPSIETMANIDPPPISYMKTGGVLIRGDNESNSAAEQNNSNVPLATGAFQTKKRIYSTQWHVRKEGFPSVHGHTNGGVAVEFVTADGKYCVTWSRESGRITLLMPNGSMIYSCGKLVKFDASDGTKRSDPKQSSKNQATGGASFINTNGIYVFNLERTNLTYTNNSGNGFQSTWGYKVELITNGVLQRPPKVVDPLSQEVSIAMSNNQEASANTTCYNKSETLQPIQSNKIGPPLSPKAEDTKVYSDSSLTTTDVGQVSESITGGLEQSSTSNKGETNETNDPVLGPSVRLFVIHEGGFGFEIIHEDEYNKYTSSKKWSKDYTHVREVYKEVNAILHTFVTVQQKAKKLAEVFVQALEGCRAPDVLKLWTTKVSEFARRIKLRAIKTKMNRRTKCDWLQTNLNLPYLPRVLEPNLLPPLPLSNATTVVFRQIFEYPPFQDEQLPIMKRILESYNKWQENAMMLTDVAQNPDTRTEDEIKLAQHVANKIREVSAEKRLCEARDRAAVEVQHATEIFRKMMNIEIERLQKFEESKNELRKKRESDWIEYKESKKGPLPCVHNPFGNLQTKGPYRPGAEVQLHYFECEEGLHFIISLQTYQNWQQYPEDPRHWSMEALPPLSCHGSEVSQSSVEQDGTTTDYEVPCITTDFKEEAVPKESPCLLSEWMRELETKSSQDEDDDEGKMCWELVKAERKKLGPADWTCFLVGFDEKCEDSDANLVIKLSEIKEAHPDPIVVKVTKEPYVAAEEVGAPPIPLPVLQPFWSIPTGKEWEINDAAVQRQSELIPNFPGWSKAGWRKNKKYLDVNLGTLLCVNISSIGTLSKRPQPPKDWSHQFLLVPDFLDFGIVEYGTISMKVMFLQNYHGTKPGRFRVENLGSSVKFSCELGMVPPGLSRAIRIFFRASALGYFNHEIRVLTQYDVFEVSLFAEVVRPKNY
ncbi:unnamed protein product [Calypogeia fissa]